MAEMNSMPGAMPQPQQPQRGASPLAQRPKLSKAAQKNQSQQQQQPAAPSQSHILSKAGVSKKRLQDLVREIDPLEQLDEEVEEVLMQIADDFIESVVSQSCLMAKHRKSKTLEVKDVQLHLERCWNIWIPGFGSDDVRSYRKSTTTDAHKQRLALIKKASKK